MSISCRMKSNPEILFKWGAVVGPTAVGPSRRETKLIRLTKLD